MVTVFDLKKYEEFTKANVNWFPDYKKVLPESDAKKIEEIVKKTVEIFKHYIKGVYVAGSFVTGYKKEKLSDIDIMFIVDDTDVQKMSREEVQSRLLTKIYEIARSTLKSAHPQVYLLTEWWKWMSSGEPVLFHSLLSGAIVYQSEDGFLETFKRLIALGKIRVTGEQVDNLLFTAKEMIRLAKESVPERIIYNLEQATLHVSEALMVELGYRPVELQAFLRSTLPIQTSKEALESIKKNLFEREKLISEEDVKLIERLIKLREDYEKGELKISGEEIDELINKSENYIKKILEIIKKLREEKGEKWLLGELLKKEEKERKVKSRDGIVEEYR